METWREVWEDLTRLIESDEYGMKDCYASTMICLDGVEHSFNFTIKKLEKV